MKTRENELHEPEISTGADIYVEGRGFLEADYVCCSVCHRGLARVLASVSDMKKYYPNYCPNCGARLKEDVE